MNSGNLGLAICQLEYAPPASRRPARVMVLVAGVLVLSLADLIITLAHLRTIGMVEANPIAAFLIRATDSALALIAFKTATVGTCVALLYRLRRHLASEIAAWCGLGILAIMCVMWHRYSTELESPASLVLAQLDEDWQHLE